MAIFFDWRVALEEKTRDALQESIVKKLGGLIDADQKPSKVIVSSPTPDQLAGRVSIEIFSESGQLLGAGQMKLAEEQTSDLVVSDGKFDPAKTYVLEETVRTQSLSLEQLADMAAQTENSPELDFESALEPHKPQEKSEKE